MVVINFLFSRVQVESEKSELALNVQAVLKVVDNYFRGA